MAFYMKMGSKSLKASGINLNGSPLPKCGDPGQPPCPPSQASVDSKAQINADKATKTITGGSSNIVNNDDGTMTLTRKRNWTQDGKANEKPKNLPSYASVGVSQKEGDAYWASKRNSGTDTETITSINLKPYDVELRPMEIKANVDIQLPKKRFKSVEMPEVEKRTGLTGGSTTIEQKKQKGYVEQQNLASKRKRRGGGCPSGRRCKGAVN